MLLPLLCAWVLLWPIGLSPAHETDTFAFCFVFQGNTHHGHDDDSVSGTQGAADGIAAHESIARPPSVPAPPLPGLVAQSHPQSGEASSSQIEVGKAVAGNITKSDGTTSTSAPASSGVISEVTQQESSSSAPAPAAAPVSVSLPLNGGTSSSNETATESASVFDIVSSSEPSAHSGVCSDSVGPSTADTNHAEHKTDARQVLETRDKEGDKQKTPKSLEAASAESTFLDMTAAPQRDTLLDMSTQPVDGNRDEIGEETQIDHDQEDDRNTRDYEDHEQINAETAQPEHLPEPPASPVSNTLLSTPSNSTYEDAGGMKAESKTRVPSANRISISYAGGNRRLVIDAEVVQKMKVLRQAGMIEVVMDVIRFNENELKGILVSISFVCAYSLEADRVVRIV